MTRFPHSLCGESALMRALSQESSPMNRIKQGLLPEQPPSLPKPPAPLSAPPEAPPADKRRQRLNRSGDTVQQLTANVLRDVEPG